MAKRKPKDHSGRQRNGNSKLQDLATFRENPAEQHPTTDQGLRINDEINGDPGGWTWRPDGSGRRGSGGSAS
jgi:hypothetical protein